uniref:MULE transposase domain-containing protein n=1 Tax=Lactuca sativa TaxID=4236 RepID=A0A9R1VHY5_LACSA|nr:hypothetical protein LSAT_V11C500267340 [Lactuca sativa]
MNNTWTKRYTYWQAWNGKMYALNLLKWTLEESLQRLPLYYYKNPGTVKHTKTSNDNKYEYIFIVIGYVHPIIIIDGTHLKGKYLFTMFQTVGMDCNHQIHPIAFGVGKTENGESWIWFLSRLKECIRDMPYIPVISDRANSIEIATQVVFLNTYHELYCRHLLMNMRVKMGMQTRT